MLLILITLFKIIIYKIQKFSKTEKYKYLSYKIKYYMKIMASIYLSIKFLPFFADLYPFFIDLYIFFINLYIFSQSFEEIVIYIEDLANFILFFVCIYILRKKI